MSWFSRKPSQVELLVSLLKEDRAAQLEVQKMQMSAMERMMATTEAQSGMLAQWLKLFADPPKPEVRVMTDVDEARYERLRAPDDKDAYTPHTFDPHEWMSDMAVTFKDLKAQL